MNRFLVLIYGVVACALALAGFLSVTAFAVQKSIGIGQAPPWPGVLLSAVVLLTGVVGHHLVGRLDERSSPQNTSGVRSLTLIAIICCMGLLVSLCAAIFGLDLSGSWP